MVISVEVMGRLSEKTGPKVIKLFSCSTEKFKMLISIKISRKLAYFRLRSASNAIFPAYKY